MEQYTEKLAKRLYKGQNILGGDFSKIPSFVLFKDGIFLIKLLPPYTLYFYIKKVLVRYLYFRW